MLKAPSEFIIVFIAISVLLILAMAVFISLIIYRYQQRQNIYFKDIESLKTSHENILLQSQLEMQELTFQTISREIHDNIGQKLTLAKLYLNTLDFAVLQKTTIQVANAVEIISECITELSDLSRSMSSEVVLSNGLIKSVEFETTQLARSGIYAIDFSATGNPIFMKSDTELLVFRMVQEALNNIVKHAKASVITVNLHYTDQLLLVRIHDNGCGFDTAETSAGTGLRNIKKRATMLKGNVAITSTPGAGTKIKIEIELNENAL